MSALVWENSNWRRKWNVKLPSKRVKKLGDTNTFFVGLVVSHLDQEVVMKKINNVAPSMPRSSVPPPPPSRKPKTLDIPRAECRSWQNTRSRLETGHSTNTPVVMSIYPLRSVCVKYVFFSLNRCADTERRCAFWPDYPIIWVGEVAALLFK